MPGVDIAVGGAYRRRARIIKSARAPITTTARHWPRDITPQLTR